MRISLVAPPIWHAWIATVFALIVMVLFALVAATVYREKSLANAFTMARRITFWVVVFSLELALLVMLFRTIRRRKMGTVLEVTADQLRIASPDLGVPEHVIPLAELIGIRSVRLGRGWGLQPVAELRIRGSSPLPLRLLRGRDYQLVDWVCAQVNSAVVESQARSSIATNRIDSPPQ